MSGLAATSGISTLHRLYPIVVLALLKVYIVTEEHKIVTRKNAKELGLTRYYPGTICIRGHISERWTASAKCVSCHYEDNPLKPKRIFTDEERVAAQKANKRRYYLKNKELNLERGREWKKNNPDKLKKSWADWRKKPNSKSITFMRDSLRRVLKVEKYGRTEAILGYTRSELRNHIERQFQPGMTWENHGEWHIDHITPISKLLAEGVTDPAVINCLSNLRPLWAMENMRKNDRQDYLL